jgi:DNA-binding MarR family transcriptional regulator
MSTEPSIDNDVNELFRLLLRFIRNMKSQAPGAGEVRRLLGEANLGPRHLGVLVALAMSGPASIGELADRMGLNPATMSQLIGELNRGGFVDRREDATDRRRTIISLDEGRRGLIEPFARRRLDPLRVTMAALSPEERAPFLRGLRVLVEAQEQGERPERPERLTRGA